MLKWRRESYGTVHSCIISWIWCTSQTRQTVFPFPGNLHLKMSVLQDLWIHPLQVQGSHGHINQGFLKCLGNPKCPGKIKSDWIPIMNILFFPLLKIFLLQDIAFGLSKTHKLWWCGESFFWIGLNSFFSVNLSVNHLEWRNVFFFFNPPVITNCWKGHGKAREISLGRSCRNAQVKSHQVK